MDTHKKYCDEIINAQAGVMPGLDKLKEAIKEANLTEANDTPRCPTCGKAISKTGGCT